MLLCPFEFILTFFFGISCEFAMDGSVRASASENVFVEPTMFSSDETIILF